MVGGVTRLYLGDFRRNGQFFSKMLFGPEILLKMN